METIFCPHCSSSYQIPGEKQDGPLACLSCGEIIGDKIQKDAPAPNDSSAGNLSGANAQHKKEYLVLPFKAQQKPVLGGLLKVAAIPEPEEITAFLNDRAKEGWVFKQCIANPNYGVNSVPFSFILERDI